MKKFLERYEQSNSNQEKEELVKKAVHQYLDEQLKEKMRKNLPRKRKPILERQRLSWPRVLTIAASIAILVLAVYFFAQDQTTPQQLAAQYLSNTEMFHPGLPKGEVDETMSARARAIRAYEERNYALAAQQFASISEPNDQDQFYQALSLLKSERTQEAADVFEQIKNQERYAEERTWCHALSLILNHNENEAIDLLKQIKAGDWKFDEAQHLLQVLANHSLEE